ncbi:fluoride efflux transporter CrcB [Brevibacterium daeguense]|uniref:fluoride efflux transporter CrcB n=1 Tax=Brevibacterium daeguense TaxID=909936 RepID=UPI001F01B53E|nr:fluoride efflux transporter CrcB [Brevibacterium daeguense]
MVALGGTIGTVLRHAVGGLIPTVAGLPLNTFLINVSGAFLLGLLASALALRGPDRGPRRELRLLLGTGVLGGYTTYSLLALETASLMLESRILEALGYGLVTVVLGVLASWAGMLTGRSGRRRA